MNINKIAKTLFDDCNNLKPYLEAEKISIENRKDGYLVQDEFLKLKQNNGEGKIAGWKVALTNIEMQKLTGIDEPAEGAILQPLIYFNNTKLNYIDYGHLGAEAEIAIRIAKDIPTDSPKFLSIEEIAPYVLDVMAALEIVDDRHYGRKATLGILIGQNSMNKGCVLGNPVNIDPMSLDKLVGNLVMSNKTFGTGSGKNVLGHPLKALMWLANSLISRGRTLKSGDIIMTGSIATTCWPEVGDKVIADIEGLYPASLEVV
tara:strand:+ start:83 stop:862 length:780 start_codon:yes stop_codon:yes gene_type:complete